MKKLALIILALNLSGCATYFLRKKCEDVNWFQYGQDVAMKGQNLENDKFLNQCKKAEAEIDEGGLDRGFKKGRANYCEPQTAFATGKKGDPFASEMCDGGNLQTLRKRHADGVKEFCDPSNGEPAGATGKTYQNVCPKGLEGPFLREFNKGRKRYLAAEVDSRQQQIDDLDRDIRSLQQDRMLKQQELASVGSRITRSQQTRDVFGRRRETVEQVSVADDEAAKKRREDVESDISDLDFQIRNKRRNQDTIREEIRGLRSEMLAL